MYADEYSDKPNNGKWVGQNWDMTAATLSKEILGPNGLYKYLSP